MGGLSRRSSFLQSIQSKQALISVEVGSLFSEDLQSTDPGLKKTRLITQTLVNSGIHGVALSATDWALNPHEMPQLLESLNLPVLAANLRCKQGLGIKAQRRIQIGGLSLQLIGLTNGAPVGCTLLEVKPALQDVIQSSERADLTVLLAPFGLEEVRVLIEDIEGFDIVVHAEGDSKPPEEAPNGTLFVGTWTRGRLQGVINLGKRANPGRLVKLSNNRSAWWRHVTLDHTIEDMPSINQQVDEYKRQSTAMAQEDRQKALWLVAPSDSSYAGADACGVCHANQHHQWSTTAHARAWAALEKSDHDADKTCISCHATAVMEQGDAMQGLRGIQCEACHGPSRAHADAMINKRVQGEAGSDDLLTTRSPAPEVCLSCHTADRDQGRFELADYKKKITH